MSDKTTYVSIILDKSGSMSAAANGAVANFNEQIQQMKQNSDTQKIFCSLITFNGNVYENCWNETASSIEEAELNTFHPCGSTALFDAIGYTISKMKKSTKDDTSDKAYLVIIISDGEENASSHYDQTSIGQLISSCKEEGNWTFTYLGCDERYIKNIAKSLNIAAADCAVWSNQTDESAYTSLRCSSDAIGSYYTERARGVKSLTGLHSNDGDIANYAESVLKYDPQNSTSSVASFNNQVSICSVSNPTYTNKSVTRSINKTKSTSSKKSIFETSTAVKF
jgi:uncharacterized protein YegL